MAKFEKNPAQRTRTISPFAMSMREVTLDLNYLRMSQDTVSDAYVKAIALL